MSRLLLRMAVVAFIVIDLVLVVAAVRHVSGASEPGSGIAASAPTTSSPSTSAPTPTRTSTAAKVDRDKLVSSALSDDGGLIFATRGDCDQPDPASVTISDDAGKTVRKVDASVNTVLTVSSQGDGAFSLVGAGDDCTLVQRSTDDGGRTWTSDDDVTLPHPDLEDPATFVGSKPRRIGGCDTVTSVSVVTAALLRVTCATGRLGGSGDAGQTWKPLGTLPDVRSASFTSPSKAYALAPYQGCGATSFSTRDGGRTWRPAGCITGESAQSVAAASSLLLAVVDNEVYASEDEGVTWVPASDG